jgi:small conductance mechanosensitive channel
MTDIFTVQFWQTFFQEALQAAASRGLRILAILLLYWVLSKVLRRFIQAGLSRLVMRQEQSGEDQANRLRTLQGLVQSIVSYTLLFVLIIMLLDALGVNVTGIITTAGVGGLAIGFGAQKLVRDVISGFFFIVENQFAVGEYVTIGGGPGTIAGAGSVGIVEEVGMRITRLRDDQGRLWTIANGDITAVINHSRAPVEATIEIGIATGADVEKAQDLVNQAGEALYRQEGHRLQAPPRSQGIAAFDAVKTTLRVAIVSDPRALAVEQTRVRQAILERFVQEEIPLA